MKLSEKELTEVIAEEIDEMLDEGWFTDKLKGAASKVKGAFGSKPEKSPRGIAFGKMQEIIKTSSSSLHAISKQIDQTLGEINDMGLNERDSEVIRLTLEAIQNNLRKTMPIIKRSFTRAKTVYSKTKE